LAVLGVGGYFAYKKFSKKAQFNRFVKATKESGSDIFDGKTPQTLANWFKGWQGLTNEEANRFIELQENQEKNIEENLEIAQLFKTIAKHIKGS